ncbi:transcriptional regulator FtrA [Paracoccus aestuariivivens]|uniref:Transcriptional regulator FtrA n=1 Tax=Paracoccus aestuariivivens TaxID=1820333 RepID=A0A6L6JK55_9RHOB|nr:transcriptional regulator FtrA [Paracoccus aestuariivivens]MTH80261.1 transcriptional regulator FtrA [Paracoccus aestuariivivens]
MTLFVTIMPIAHHASETPPGPLVAALLYDGLCTFEFGITAEVFGLYRPEMGPSWYRFVSCAIEPGPLRAHGGFTITPDRGDDALQEADIIVVPGWKGTDAPVPETLCEKLRAAHARGARLISICSGAFVLAATGLLAGRTITTHWRHAKVLQERYPDLTVDAAALYRTEGRIFTSAGSAAGIDLLISTVRDDFGPEAANSVARRLVVPAHRTGGQAQFLERPVPARPTGEIAPLLDKIRDTLGKDWTTAAMADACGLSLRTFLRRFEEATGGSPGLWLIAERIEAAKALLTRQEIGIDAVSHAVGFGSGHALRKQLRKATGLTPTEYRSRFLHNDSVKSW